MESWNSFVLALGNLFKFLGKLPCKCRFSLTTNERLSWLFPWIYYAWYIHNVHLLFRIKDIAYKYSDLWSLWGRVFRLFQDWWTHSLIDFMVLKHLYNSQPFQLTSYYQRGCIWIFSQLENVLRLLMTLVPTLTLMQRFWEYEISVLRISSWKPYFSFRKLFIHISIGRYNGEICIIIILGLSNVF